MALRLSNYRYGSKRRPGEGLRLGSARLLPRGVKKEDYAARTTWMCGCRHWRRAVSC